jgi:hypothetical protein
MVVHDIWADLFGPVGAEGSMAITRSILEEYCPIKGIWNMQFRGNQGAGEKGLLTGL